MLFKFTSLLKSSKKQEHGTVPRTLTEYVLTSRLHYVFDVDQCNGLLHHIHKGVVGFDTEFQTGKAVNTMDPIDWDVAKLRVIQIAFKSDVYVIHISRMRAIPQGVIRILESAAIMKVGVDFGNDARVINEVLAATMVNFVDVGVMTRFWLAGVKFLEHGQHPVGLEICAAEVLGVKMDKAAKHSNWGALDELTPQQIQYAALDAQAVLEIYVKVKPLLRQKERDIGTNIPTFWYSHDIRQGIPTMRQISVRGEYLQWSPKFSPWYQMGIFQAFYK
ncbi:ribonuclease H-like domain-containing protein [Mycena sanguinolenta]|nr:ribonuclease H-like domain-containing protein [Mycena sanguinolenta]